VKRLAELRSLLLQVEHSPSPLHELAQAANVMRPTFLALRRQLNARAVRHVSPVALPATVAHVSGGPPYFPPASSVAYYAIRAELVHGNSTADEEGNPRPVGYDVTGRYWASFRYPRYSATARAQVDLRVPVDPAGVMRRWNHMTERLRAALAMVFWRVPCPAERGTICTLGS
jgi:hypothetical protein